MKETSCDEKYIIDTIENDYFSRNDILISLIELIHSNDININSICINAPWGTGKTLLCHQLAYLIKNLKDLPDLNLKSHLESIKDDSNIGTFYFNSWENDNINATSISLLYNILRDDTFIDPNKKEQLKEMALTTGKILLKIITKNTISADDIKESPSLFDEIFLSQNIHNTFNETINKYLTMKHLNKLVILIDELDRCRPDYAVNMLEFTKHFFTNENIIFIFSIDLVQLSHTIKKFYGDNYDSNLYLQRFFDRIVTLDSPNIDNYISSVFNYELNQSYIQNTLALHLIHYLDMSVRETNEFILTLDRIHESFNIHPNKYVLIGFVVFVVIGIALKIKNISMYTEYLQGNFKIQFFSDLFKNQSDLLNQLGVLLSKHPDDVVSQLYDIYLDIFDATAPKNQFISQIYVNKIISLLKYEL